MFVEYLIDLMQETENVARGKVDDLPLLSVNPPSMTSQMETEQRLAVTTRYRSRFAKSLELAVPEPLSQSTPSVSESLPVVRNVTTTPRRGKRTSPGQSLSKSKRKLNPN